MSDSDAVVFAEPAAVLPVTALPVPEVPEEVPPAVAADADEALELAVEVPEDVPLAEAPAAAVLPETAPPVAVLPAAVPPGAAEVDFLIMLVSEMVTVLVLPFAVKLTLPPGAPPP
jgi:hypothetical protein